MISANENIINKLEIFIKNFYLNELKKGVSFSILILAVVVLLAVFTEHLFRLNSIGRGVLFFGLIATLSFVVYRYIFLPGAGLFGLKRELSNEAAAKLVGKSIDEVGDSLINRLQLEKKGSALALASIQDRELALSHIEFRKAISEAWIKRVLPYLGLVVFIYAIIVLVSPGVITDSGKRVIEYSVPHHLIPSFDYQVNYTESIKRGSALNIEVGVSGDEIPSDMACLYKGNSYFPEKRGSSFSFKLDDLSESGNFTIKSGKYDLGTYSFSILPNPELVGGVVLLEYPNYLQRADQEVALSSDITVPAGTMCSFKLELLDAQDAELHFDSIRIKAESLKWSNAISITGSEPYNIKSGSDTIRKNLNLNAVLDEFPYVEVVRDVDSLRSELIFMNGIASDDYGIRSASLIVESEGQVLSKKSLSINGTSEVVIAAVFNAADLNLEPGVQVEYYIEVVDNDAPNGYKTSRSQRFFYYALSVGESEKKKRQAEDRLKSDLDKATEELQELKKMTTDAKSIDPEDEFASFQNREQLANKLKDIQSQLENAVKNKKKEENRRVENHKKSSEVLEKQNALDEFIEKTIDEETKKMLEKLAERLDELDEKDLDDIEMSLEEVLESMENNLEMFKKLSVELGIEEQIEELESLANVQKELANDSLVSDEERAIKQDSIAKEMEELNNEVNELKKENEELDSPFDMDWADKERESAESNSNKAKEDAKQGRPQKSSKSGKSSAADMKNAKQKMQNSLNKSREQKQTENMENLRQVQENLLRLSFNQEDVLNEQLTINVNDPKFRKLTVDQKDVVDDFEIVEDSLKALYKRVIQLEQTIKPEVVKIREALPVAVKGMESRNKPASSQRQREAMTSMNNLALMLSEVIQQMQQQMAQSKFGDGACNKPGSGAKPGMSKMKGEQEALKKEMEKLLDELAKEGKAKGKGKKGTEKGNGSGQGNSLGGSKGNLAKMAAQQQAIREEMRRMAEQTAGNGGGGSLLKDLENEMEKVEDDLLYNQVSLETIKRQEEILTKMLKAEEALRQQEEDENRESESGESIKQEESNRLEEYLREREKELEILRLRKIDFIPYFEKKSSRYLQSSSSL